MTVPPSGHRRLGSAARERLAAQRFVLVAPSHPGNIGAVARAMMTMGLADLVVVAPRDPAFASHPEAIARASGADALLGSATVVDSLAAAIGDCQVAVAVSSDPREFGPEPRAPLEVVSVAWQALDDGSAERVAWVFGPERTGLSIVDVGQCGHLLTIPAEPSFASLNLAQAAQVVAYVLRDRVLAGAIAGPRPEEHRVHPKAAAGDALADHLAVEALYAHLERALVRIGFLDPAHPKKLMARIRRLFARAGLQQAEVELLRGVCKQIEQHGRAGDERSEPPDGR